MPDTSDARLEALQRLLRPLDDGRVEVVVTYRRHEDYEAYELELEKLRAENKRLQQDIYTWTMMGNQYLSTLDEKRRLEMILRKHKIPF